MKTKYIIDSDSETEVMVEQQTSGSSGSAPAPAPVPYMSYPPPPAFGAARMPAPAGSSTSHPPYQFFSPYPYPYPMSYYQYGPYMSSVGLAADHSALSTWAETPKRHEPVPERISRPVEKKKPKIEQSSKAGRSSVADKKPKTSRIESCDDDDSTRSRGGRGPRSKDEESLDYVCFHCRACFQRFDVMSGMKAHLKESEKCKKVASFNQDEGATLNQWRHIECFGGIGYDELMAFIGIDDFQYEKFEEFIVSHGVPVADSPMRTISTELLKIPPMPGQKFIKYWYWNKDKKAPSSALKDNAPEPSSARKDSGPIPSSTRRENSTPNPAVHDEEYSVEFVNAVNSKQPKEEHHPEEVDALDDLPLTQPNPDVDNLSDSSTQSIVRRKRTTGRRRK